VEHSVLTVKTDLVPGNCRDALRFHGVRY